MSKLVQMISTPATMHITGSIEGMHKRLASYITSSKMANGDDRHDIDADALLVDVALLWALSNSDPDDMLNRLDALYEAIQAALEHQPASSLQ